MPSAPKSDEAKIGVPRLNRSLQHSVQLLTSLCHEFIVTDSMCFVAAVETLCARMWLWDFLQEFGVPMFYDPPYISFKCIDMSLLILMYVIWSMHVSADRTSSSQRCVLISRVLIEKQPLDLVVTSVRTRYHIRHLEKPVENNSLAGFEGLVAKDSSWWCDGRTWLSRGVTVISIP